MLDGVKSRVVGTAAKFTMMPYACVNKACARRSWRRDDFFLVSVVWVMHRREF